MCSHHSYNNVGVETFQVWAADSKSGLDNGEASFITYHLGFLSFLFRHAEIFREKKI